jgi:cytochrome c oxidase cbb3-type subunit 2
VDRTATLLLGCLLTFSSSWMGLVVAPYFQLENTAAKEIEGGPAFPQPYQGSVAQGRRVYIANGCIYCHSQQVRPQGYGADFERGWAGTGVDNPPRRSVPRDYIYDRPHQLGTMRTGPDLTNIGERQKSAVWHHTHLYNPRAAMPGSIMPDFEFLYEKRKVIGQRSPEAVAGVEVEEGYEIVPTDDAKALVDYLLFLNRTTPLPEAGT